LLNQLGTIIYLKDKPLAAPIAIFTLRLQVKLILLPT